MLDDEVVIRLLEHGAVRSADGRRLGRVGQLFRSDSDGEATWVSIDSGKPGDDLQTLVPMAGATFDGDDLHVAYPSDAITGAPQVAVGAAVSGDDERRVREFYAMDGAGGRSQTDGSSHSASAGSAAADVVSVVRSEEQLRVDTRWVPVRRARLEKFQVTETRTIEVPWTHEDVRVVYEPLDSAAATAGPPPAADAPAGPTARPWVLMEERIVVTKEWVPAETARLVVTRVSGEQQVTEAVRKEQISLDPVEPASTSDHPPADLQPVAGPVPALAAD